MNGASQWMKNSGPSLTEIDPLEKFDLVTQLSMGKIKKSIEDGNIAFVNGGNPYSPDGRTGGGRLTTGPGG